MKQHSSVDDGWLLTTTPCPHCAKRTVMVREIIVAKPIGSFSLAGVQMKFSARKSWTYHCNSCGTDGNAEPKHEYSDEDLEQARAFTQQEMKPCAES